MIEITEKKRCTGCSACSCVCPTEAIRMVEDEEGFLYPQVDRKICIGCGRCDAVCPMLDKFYGHRYIGIETNSTFFAAQLLDKKDLNEVSSGGAFWGLAKKVLDNGGIVYGAVQENVDDIYHIRVATVKDAEAIRRSKYFQSNIADAYKNARDDLGRGDMVIFSGTPCQIAGLNCFLGKPYPNLVTCEVVCHGVASKNVFRHYRSELEKKQGSKIKEIIFRDKSRGWSRNQYRIAFEDGHTIFEQSKKNRFHVGYLLGLFYRPSCGECPFASMPRVADITLADFWRYSGRLFAANGDVGVSLIAANNNKGAQLLREAERYLEIEPTKRLIAIGSCRHLTKSPNASPRRDRFIKMVRRDGYSKAASRFFPFEKLRIGMDRLVEFVCIK